MIFTRMFQSETRLTSNTFSIHFSATNTPTPAVPLLFSDQNSLYLESLLVIIRQWPPRYLVSWTQQRSTFLRDSVSTTSQTLPFRVFTLRMPTLKFLRCLLDLPQWPEPAPPPTPERGPSRRRHWQKSGFCQHRLTWLHLLILPCLFLELRFFWDRLS